MIWKQSAFAFVVALLSVIWFSAPGEAQSPPAWENVTPKGLAARGIATDPTHPGWVYAGLQDNVAGNGGGRGIWKSTNYGATWARVDIPWSGTCGAFNGIPMSLAVGSDGAVWAVNVYGCDQGVLKSTDGGVNWVNKFGGDFNNVSIDPSNPNHIIAGYHSRHDVCNDPCDTGMVESLDGGATWRTSAVVTGAGWSTWAHFVNSTTWLVLGHGQGLFRTTNSGNTWARVAQPHSSFSGDVLQVGSAIYVGFNGGALRSTNDGATWTQVLTDNSADEYTSFAADSSGRIYTHSAYPFGGQAGGPYKTSVDGVTWSNVNSQNFSNGPAHMASDAHYVYSANWNLGLWRLQVGGTPSPTMSASISPSGAAGLTILIDTSVALPAGIW